MWNSTADLRARADQRRPVLLLAHADPAALLAHAHHAGGQLALVRGAAGGDRVLDLCSTESL